MSVMNGASLHSTNRSSGVTSTSPPSLRLVRPRCSFVPSLYPCIWGHGSPNMNMDKARISTFQKELQPRVSHISQLAISARPFNLERVLEGLVSPAPILQYLSLSGKKYRRRIDGQPFVPVPVTLFNGSTPRLSRLELKYCDISWKSPLFRSLNHLKITRLSADARPRLSFWLDALDEIPQL
ncbi:hypothetical protein EDB92DRAFT_1904116, partial [Lactarius akahatsu]